MARFSEERAHHKARVRRKDVAATTEKDLARQAAEDGTETAAAEFEAAPRQGRVRVIRPLDVAAIRAKTCLSQERFARAFQISPHTLRNWEQGRRLPQGPARALLLAIDRDPEAVMRALRHFDAADEMPPNRGIKSGSTIPNSLQTIKLTSTGSKTSGTR